MQSQLGSFLAPACCSIVALSHPVVAGTVSITSGVETGSIVVKLEEATLPELLDALSKRHGLTIEGNLGGTDVERFSGQWYGSIEQILQRALRSQNYVLIGTPQRIVLLKSLGSGPTPQIGMSGSTEDSLAKAPPADTVQRQVADTRILRPVAGEGLSDRGFESGGKEGASTPNAALPFDAALPALTNSSSSDPLLGSLYQQALSGAGSIYSAPPGNQSFGETNIEAEMRRIAEKAQQEFTGIAGRLKSYCLGDTCPR